MEWRGQKTVSSDLAFSEAQRWVEEVTQKSFGSSNFRLALENGVLLCDLVNKLRPGIINRVNRLSTPIAGLDNVNVFLKACRKLGLNEAQLFHPGDLQDVSTRVTVRREETNRRIKNVLITLYWLGRKAQADPFYSGPLLNLKAFEGLLGTTLTKALEEWSPRWSVRDSGYSESWFPDREELLGLQATASCKSEDSIESLDSTESRTLSATSDTTLRAGSEGCGSDAEAEQGFRMADSRDGRGRGYMPTPLRRKREQHEDTRTSPLIREGGGVCCGGIPMRGVIVHDPHSSAFTPHTPRSPSPPSSVASSSAVAFLQRARDYRSSEESSDSDSDPHGAGGGGGGRPDPDLINDDLASRRFRTPTPTTTPFNFAVPAHPVSLSRHQPHPHPHPLGSRPHGLLPTATPRGPRSWVGVSDASRMFCSSTSPRSSGTVSPRSCDLDPVTPPPPTSMTAMMTSCPPDRETQEALFLQALQRHLADGGGHDDSSSEEEEEERRRQGQGRDPDPVLDDFYARRVGQSVHLTSSNPGADRFMPKHWTPEEDVHVKRIQLGSQRRPWYKKLQGFRSKSLSDIPLGPLSSAPPHPPLFRSSLTFDISLEAAAAGQMRQEHMRRVHGTVRETDDKWQEDLNAWKNKRRSTKSSLHRKTEDEDTNPNKSEREAHGNYVTAATCYPAQVAHTPLLQQQPQAHVQPQHQEAFVYTPRLRASLARTDAQDLPRAGSPSRGRPPSSEPAAHGESPSLGSLPSDLASSLNPSSGSQLGTTIATTTMPGLMGSSGSPGGTGMTSGVGTVGGAGVPLVPTNPSTPPPVSTTTTTSGAPKVHWNSPVSSSLTGSPLAGSRPASVVPYTATEAPDPQHDDLQHLQGASSGYRPVTPAGKSYDGGSRVSASLPRGFRRSEGTSCLSAGVTPRPFGKTSRLSMPKLYSKDDSHKSLSGIQKPERPAFSSVAAPYTKVTTPAEAEHPVAPATQSSPKQPESREEEMGLTVGRISAPVNQSSPKFTASLPDYTSGPPVVESEVLHSDMRVSLNQRPNSGTDFGFQTNWDSTGVRITSIQPGSPAEQCHLRVGDELLSVNGQRVAQLNYTQWKGTMADALAKGTLLMDVRRHGHSDWDLSGHPSLQYKSHKTLNLTTADSTLVGRPERYVNVSQEPSVAAAAPSSASHMTNGLTNNGVEPAAMNGGYHDNTEPMRNKEYERIALRNRKRRLEFFKGGSESAISDLQVPSISASSSRWSWDPEEDRKKHESWQAEQEHLLQEKYERDQQRLEDEWRRAQQETGGDASNHDGGLRGPEEHRDFERANGTVPLPYSSHSAASTFAAPNQHVEGEILVKAREGPLLNAAAPLPQGAGHDEYEGSNTNQWPDESYGFAALAPADRTKSKSTPTLDFFNKEEEDSPREFNVEKKLGQQMSQVEFERQQILDEMRKRTHLHRDSSWIRQRSSSSSYQKEPILTGPSVRRFESMDDLHSGSGSWTRPSSAASNHMRPHSALGSFGGYRGPTGRYSMGAMGMGTAGSSSTLPTSLSASSVRQGPWTRPASTSPTPTPLREEQGGLPQRMSKPLSGRRMCTRCERPLAKGAAMVIESLGLCYHLVCFKCVSCRSELRRPGPGSQVRVRNKQLYCDSCYGRLRARPAPK